MNDSEQQTSGSVLSFATLFNHGRPLERTVIPGGRTQGFMKADDSRNGFNPNVPAKEHRGCEYAREYVIQEEEQYLLSEQTPSTMTNKNRGEVDLADVEELTSMGTLPNIGELNLEECDNTELYNFQLKPGAFSSLPVFQYQDQLMKLMHANPVVVVKGRTGCGKSTQVPLMILENYGRARQFCNIIVTQPRRIAAISVTNSVCSAYNLSKGSLVGYQIGLDKQVSPNTRLTYCTTGVLLQKLVKMKNMTEFTHIILDEVHERTQEMDFLMLLVRKLQRTNSRNVKIILMSATIDVDPYTRYFSRIVNNKREDVPVVNIERACNHKVQIYYTDDFEAKLGPFPESKNGVENINLEAYDYVIKLIQAFDFIDSQEKNEKGSVLVFLPGIHEIENMYDALNKGSTDSRGNKLYLWWICPLHSTITSEEQMKVFQRPPRGNRKIILSTNIAESSITVNDIRYVIDFCLTKAMGMDLETNLSCLHMCWASKSMCEQRAGRAGRVMDGRVYRMVRKCFYDMTSYLQLFVNPPVNNYSRLIGKLYSKFEKACILDLESLSYDSEPEMLKASLETTVLKAKQLDMGEPKKILALSMDPPNLSNLEKTILKLKEVGALLMTVNGEYNEADGDLTVMGDVMASLPLDVRMTKLILLGHIFNVLTDAIVMACAMSLKSVFSRPFQKEIASYIAKLTWADSSCSDPIASCNAYDTWKNVESSGRFKLSTGGGEKAWASRYFIQLNSIKEISKLEQEVSHRLRDFGIEPRRPPDTPNWPKKKRLLIKVILAGACYPNYFMRGQIGGQVDEREAVKLLGNRDPFSTIYLMNFPLDQPGQLYSSAIKKLFDGCGLPRGNIKVSFDKSSRVYVELKSETINEDDYAYFGNRTMTAAIPGKISVAVYRALKLKHGKKVLEIPMLAPEDALKRVRKAQKLMSEEKKHGKSSTLPSLSTEYINIVITHVNNIDNFYAQQLNHHTKVTLAAFRSILHQQRLNKATNLEENGLYTATDTDGKYFYRCKVLSLFRGGKAQVLWIDYGNVELLDFSRLFELPNDGYYKTIQGQQYHVFLKDEPPLAFNCRLAQVQPSSQLSGNRNVSDHANEWFINMCLDEKDAIGKVYSVVDEVVSLEILIPRRRRNARKWKVNEESGYLNVNNYLIERQLVEPSEESYLSKVNHEARLNHQSKVNSYDSCVEQFEEDPVQLLENEYDDINIESPTREECRRMMQLKGPFSPLEMKIFSSLRSSTSKTVSIELDSVNSILLDAAPSDPHERMLVAAHVGQSVNGNRLTLRHTTMLPSVKGLPAFLCLVFSPQVELRVDHNMSRLTGALLGLGCDPVSKKPYFPEHDSEITFDTVFSLQQIELINKLRYLLSVSLAPQNEKGYWNSNVDNQTKVLDLVFKSFELLNEQLPERVQMCTRPYEWGLIDDKYLMNPMSKVDMDSNSFIYSLIYGIAIDPNNIDMEKIRRGFQKNIDMMKKIVAGRMPFKSSVDCDLCQNTFTNLQSLKLHFSSTQHSDLSKRFLLDN